MSGELELDYNRIATLLLPLLPANCLVLLIQETSFLLKSGAQTKQQCRICQYPATIIGRRLSGGNKADKLAHLPANNQQTAR